LESRSSVDGRLKVAVFDGVDPSIVVEGKMKKSKILGAAVAFLLSGMNPAAAWEDISPLDASDMLDENPNVYILDVRTVGEYKFVGHPLVPEGQIKNIPFWKFEFDRATNEYLFYEIVDGELVANENEFFDEEVYRSFDPQTDTLIIVCRSGGRAGRAGTDLEDPSEPAANRLEKLGYFKIYRMTGGFSFGWEPEGLPVSTGYEGIWKPSDFRGRSLK
jgi:rhodanese-related sulfurtransferase